MKRVFADTSYWVAAINPSDQWAEAAEKATESIGAAAITTSLAVLVEVLNFFSARGKERIETAADAVGWIVSDNAVSVIETSMDDFAAALRLYRKRADQGYSLTDCISMDILRRLKIDDVLTSDSHFEREGFRVLMQAR
jgi:predicted nucleic acid-binding protein